MYSQVWWSFLTSTSVEDLQDNKITGPELSLAREEVTQWLSYNMIFSLLS